MQTKERPPGDFIFRIINHLGEHHDITVDSEIFEAYKTSAYRVLYLHAHNRQYTHGQPFEILTRSWCER